MAARLAPANVGRIHQSLHHVVADAPWSDAAVLRQVRSAVLPAMQKRGPVVCWIVDDTGFPKKGSHSVGVARQYCGQVGKQDNCRVAVSLSVATWSSSLPIAYSLYLPEVWANDKRRRKEAGIPKEVQFQTKPQIALGQIRAAVEEKVPKGVVVADAGYGVDGAFRRGITELGLEYVVGVQSSMTVWKPGMNPLPPLPRKRLGRPPRLLRRDPEHQPVSVKQLALSLPAEAWRSVTWRQGTRHKLRSRFAAVRVRPAHRDYWQAEPHPEEWLLHRMAERRSRAGQILVIDAGRANQTEATRRDCQTALDYRAGLPGTETGTRTRPLRRQRVARLSSPRHAVHCRVWVPGRRAEPFFPLRARRRSGTICPRDPAGLPPTGLASDPSGIIHCRSQRSESCWPAICSGVSLSVRFVDRLRDSLRRPRRRRKRRFVGGNGWQRYAMYRFRAQRLFLVSPARCSASLPASQLVPVRCRSLPHTDNRAPATVRRCCAPVDAGKANAGGLHTVRRWNVGS